MTGEEPWLDALRVALLLGLSAVCFWVARRLGRMDCGMADESDCGGLVVSPW